MKNCFQNKINFPRRYSTQQKKNAMKNSFGKNSGEEILSGEIGRSDNIMRRNLNAVKIPCGEISGGKISGSKILLTLEGPGGQINPHCNFQILIAIYM